MEPLWLAFTLFAVGLVLMACELFLPGGVVGGLGALTCVAGVVACYFHSQTAGSLSLLALFLFIPVAGWLWVKNAPRLPGARSLFLTGTEIDSSGTPQFVVRAGQAGVAISELRPGGVCDIAGQRVPAQSEDGIIEPNTPVTVVSYAHGRAVVRAAAVEG